MKPLSRRTFLRGAGLTIGLPMLEAMIPLRASAAPPAHLKFLGVYFANGIRFTPDFRVNNWFPGGDGANFTMTDVMSPLNNLKSYIIPIQGIRGATNEGHAGAPVCLLTGQTPNISDANTSLLELKGAGRSIDWDMAAIGPQLPIRVLNAGVMNKADRGVSHNYNKMYQVRISWQSRAQQADRHDNSVSMFREIFGANPGNTPTTTPTTPMVDANEIERKRRDKSILDFVLGDVQSLSKKLGSSDNARLDQYLTSVREIERRVAMENPAPIGGTQPPAPMPMTCTKPPESQFTQEGYNQRAKNMGDLIVLAFQCNVTRVATLMLDNEGNEEDVKQRIGNDIGNPEYSGSHWVSHWNMRGHGPLCDRINKLQVSQYAYILEKLRQSSDLDGGNMLDNTISLYGSGISDGAGHHNTNLPIIVAGKGGGTIQTGRFIKAGNVHIGDLLAALGKKWGLNINKFGEGGGVWGGI